MRVPQEIADTIIDHIWLPDSLDGPQPFESRQFVATECTDLRQPPLYVKGRGARVGALRACALTCKSFQPRSQMHLFSVVQCARSKWQPNPRLFMLDRMLTGSPHIGPLYVRHLRLVGVPGDFPDEATQDSIMVARILSHLPNLKRLDVVSVFANGKIAFPPAVGGAINSLSFLHTLRLYDFTFPDAAALDSLLSHARALQVLSLEFISFDQRTVEPVSPAPREATVVLASLRLQGVNTLHVDAIIAAFRAVDIKHLRSLDIQSMSSARPLLLANAHTIERVRYRFWDFYGDFVAAPDLLAGNASLQFIEIIEPCVNLVGTLAFFGNLGHLAALRRISLLFADELLANSFEWDWLNSILAQAGGSLEGVHFYKCHHNFFAKMPSVAEMRDRLPSVAKLIHVHSR
ncbi:hypothetical protein C8J57DRAFT_1729871 [Mycena rebaudengoi]|nr:hypothetical protein C8J57DRAFT_1729871 [Mycena rebaudengoi]